MEYDYRVLRSGQVDKLGLLSVLKTAPRGGSYQVSAVKETIVYLTAFIYNYSPK